MRWTLGLVVAVACGVEDVVEPEVSDAPSGRPAFAEPLATYALPFPAGTVVRVGQGYHGAFSHAGLDAYALDFPVPEGTPVVAARGGRVVSVSDDSDTGCAEPSCSAFVNRVDVDHGDGTFASYHHLAYGSAQVEVGDLVARGQPLASSGATGRTTAPHLHFQVRDVWGATRPVAFTELAASGGAAYAGADLVSGNVRGSAVAVGFTRCATDTFSFLGVTVDGAPCSVAEGVTHLTGRVWVPDAAVVVTVLDEDGFHVICADADPTFDLEIDWDSFGDDVVYTVSAGRRGSCVPFQVTSNAIALARL